MTIPMQDRLLKKKIQSTTKTFARSSIWRNRNHKNPKSTTKMITEVTDNLAKEEATTREVEIAVKGVYIRRETQISRMKSHTIRNLKDKETTTKIQIQKIPNSKITPIKFDRKEDAVATTILVEVIENKDLIGPKHSNTSPEKALKMKIINRLKTTMVLRR